MAELLQAATAPHSVPQAGTPIHLYVGFTPTQDFDAISKLRGPGTSFASNATLPGVLRPAASLHCASKFTL